MNIGGIIVVVVGVLLVIVGLRNTQSNVFPWFFKSTGSVSGSSGSSGGGTSGAA